MCWACVHIHTRTSHDVYIIVKDSPDQTTPPKSSNKNIIFLYRIIGVKVKRGAHTTHSHTHLTYIRAYAPHSARRATHSKSVFPYMRVCTTCIYVYICTYRHACGAFGAVSFGALCVSVVSHLWMAGWLFWFIHTRTQRAHWILLTTPQSACTIYRHIQYMWCGCVRMCKCATTLRAVDISSPLNLGASHSAP